MSRQLLVDTFSFKLNRLDESAAGGRKYVFEGKFGQCDVPTSNGRVYRRELMEREVNRLKKRIAERKVYGELDHPEDGKTKLQRSAVIIEDIYIDEQGQVMGRASILDTSMGKELKAIVDGNGAIGVSSRGYGSVLQNESGNQVVQDDFKLMTYDPVADPAEESAYVTTSIDQTSPSKNEPVKDPDEETDKTGDATDDADDAPKGNVSTSEGKSHETTQKTKQTEEAGSAPSQQQEAKSQAKAIIEQEQVRKLLEDQQKQFKDQLIVAVAEARKQVKAELAEQMSQDPEVAGSKLALEQVKQILAPYILNEDTQALMEAKDAKIAVLEQTVADRDEEVFEHKRTAAQMSRAAKEMGYNYYLQRELANHPRFNKIVKSLGDLSQIESLQDLKDKVAVHLEECAHLVSVAKQREHDLIKKSEMLREENLTLRQEAEYAGELAIELAARVYLERKMTGEPKLLEARKMFESSKDKTKERADAIVASLKQSRTAASDFTSIRSRITEAKKQPAGKEVVETSIKDTLPHYVSPERMSILGEQYSMEEFHKLAGQ